MGKGGLARLSAYWFALNVQGAALLTIVLPERILVLAPARHAPWLARLAALGAVVSMAVPPLAGWLSDRLRRRGVRRARFIAAGTAVNLAGLAGMAGARGLTGLALGFAVALVGQNVALAAYEALLPETVPEAEWGRASGAMGVASLLGSIVGLGASGLGTPAAALALMAGTAAAAAGWTAGVREGLPVPRSRPPGDWRAFRLTFAGRFAIMFGLTLLMTFVLYFFHDVLHAARPAAGTAAVAGFALLGASASAWVLGRLADRLPKPAVVAASTVPMAVAAAGFGLFPREGVLLLLAVLYGVGYGGFLASDWALALTAMPDREHMGRDLGLWGIASNLPAVLAPAFGGWLLSRYAAPLAGYRVLFLVSGFSFLLGGALVLAIGRPRGRRGASLGLVVGRLLVALVLLAYVRLAYRVRIEGRLPRRRGPTLVLANHQGDLEGMAIPASLFLGGPWTTAVVSAASRRLFEPGFLAGRAPRWLAPFVGWIPLAPILKALGVLPIEDQPRLRPAASFAYEVLERVGPRRVGEVFEAAWVAECERRTGRRLADRPVSCLWRGPTAAVGRETVSLQRLRQPYRDLLRQDLRARVEGELEALAEALAEGATVYLTPEGRVTTDGRMGRLRAALERLLPEAGSVFLAALAYDALRPGRLAMAVRLVPWRGGDIALALAAERPVTASQLLAAAIGEAGVAESALTAAVERAAAALPPGAHLSPDALSLRGRRLRRAVRHLERRGWLERVDGHVRWRRPVVDPRFPHVHDRVAYEEALLAETVAALRRLALPESAGRGRPAGDGLCRRLGRDGEGEEVRQAGAEEA